MIGITITKLLNAHSELIALVPSTSIFPLVVNENIPLPWIAYRVDSIESNYTKDGWAGDVVTFSVASFSNDYASLQAITKEVRLALLMESDTNTGRMEMQGFSEETDGTIFGTQLNFQVEVYSY